MRSPQDLLFVHDPGGGRVCTERSVRGKWGGMGGNVMAPAPRGPMFALFAPMGAVVFQLSSFPIFQ